MSKWYILAGLFLILSSGAACAQTANVAGGSIGLPPNTPIEGARIPNYDDEGNVTSQIFADYAYVMTNGNIEIKGLRIEMYDYVNGERVDEPEMTVTSPECFYNKDKGKIVGEKEIRISRRDFVVTGTGFMFDIASQELRILNEARLVVSASTKGFVPGE